MARLMARAAAALALVGVATTGLTACGGTARSVEAFCSTMEEHKQAYLGQMEAAQGAGVGGLITAIGAVGDLKLMWKDLAEVAPADVQADVESVSDVWQKQEDNAAAGDWMASIATGLLNGGSMSRVDAYVRENCDGDYAVDIASDSEAEVEEEIVPEDFFTTIVASESSGLIADWDEYDIGPHSVIWAQGDGKQEETTRQFRMVSAAPGEQASDVNGTVTASLPTGTVSDAVYAAQANSDADPGFAIAYVDHFPAAGAQPHNAVVTVQRFDQSGSAMGDAVPVIDQYDGKYLVGASLVSDMVALEYTDADYNRFLIGIGTDGSIMWQRDADNEVHYAHSGTLVTSVGEWSGSGGKIIGDLVGLDANTGQPLWSLAAAGFSFFGFVKPLGDGYVIAATGDRQNDFVDVVVDVRTGQVVMKVPGSESAVFYDTTTDNFVAVGKFSGDVGLQVSDASGNVSFSISPENFVALDYPDLLAATGGVVWINGADGLDLFEQATGAQHALVSRVTGAPTVAYPNRTEGFVSLFTLNSGYVIVVHQNQELTKELATDVPYQLAAG